MQLVTAWSQTFLASMLSGQKLSDGKSLGGTGRLTQARIDAMQMFYGKALRGNKGNPAAMSKSTWAILYHYSQPADHSFCPAGDDSWCKWQQDKASGNSTYIPLKDPLPPAVVDKIKPIFRDLADIRLLENCSRCLTQNANESLHSLIWSLAPKEVFKSPNEVETAIGLGCMFFNQGKSASIQRVYGALDPPLRLTPRSQTILRDLDEERVRKADHKEKPETKQARYKRKHSRLVRLNAFARKEGPSYQSGQFHERSNAAQVGGQLAREKPKCKNCGQPRKGHPRGKCPEQASDSE